MKIAIVVWDLSVSGGTQRQALELAHKLAQNHEVSIYTGRFDKKKCYPELISNLNIISLPKFSSGKNTSGYWYRFYKQYHCDDEKLKELAAKISLDHDVINLHDVNTEKVAYFLKRRSPKIPTVMMMNDLPSVFFLKERFVQDITKVSLKKKLGNIIEDMFTKIVEVQTKRYMNSVDKIIVLDKRNKRLVGKYLSRKAIVVRSGLDINKFRPKFNKDSKIFTILATGIFFRWRRYEDLIYALEILLKNNYSVHLNIVGSDKYDPEYAIEIKKLAKDLKLDKYIRYFGAVSDSKLASLYRNANAFVFPNHNQTWGLAVTEAMASGTPVIVSRTAGVHEIITDKVNGLIIKPLNPFDIYEKISFLANRPKVAESIAMNGYDYVLRNISWEKYADNLETILSD